MSPDGEEAWEREARGLLAFRPRPAGDAGQAEVRRHALRRATLPGLTRDAPRLPADDDAFRSRSTALFA